MFASIGTQSENVPEPLSHLTTEEYNRLLELVSEQLEFLGRGLIKAVVGLIRGQSRQRLDEITRLAQLPDSEGTMQAIAGATLIGATATSPEQIKEKLIESLLKSKSIAETGKVDQAQARVITFAAIVAKKVWEKKLSRR